MEDQSARDLVKLRGPLWSLRYLLEGITFLILGVGLVAGVRLVNENQDIRSRAFLQKDDEKTPKKTSTTSKKTPNTGISTGTSTSGLSGITGQNQTNTSTGQTSSPPSSNQEGKAAPSSSATGGQSVSQSQGQSVNQDQGGSSKKKKKTATKVTPTPKSTPIPDKAVSTDTTGGAGQISKQTSDSTKAVDKKESETLTPTVKPTDQSILAPTPKPTSPAKPTPTKIPPPLKPTKSTAQSQPSDLGALAGLPTKPTPAVTPLAEAPQGAPSPTPTSFPGCGCNSGEAYFSNGEQIQIDDYCYTCTCSSHTGSSSLRIGCQQPIEVVASVNLGTRELLDFAQDIEMDYEINIIVSNDLLVVVAESQDIDLLREPLTGLRRTLNLLPRAFIDRGIDYGLREVVLLDPITSPSSGARVGWTYQDGSIYVHGAQEIFRRSIAPNLAPEYSDIHVNIHEIIHNQENHPVSSSRCPNAAVDCRAIEAFLIAAEVDGLFFREDGFLDDQSSDETAGIFRIGSPRTDVEYFAEFGALYVTNPDALLHDAPEVYGVFRELYDNYVYRVLRGANNQNHIVRMVSEEKPKD